MFNALNTMNQNITLPITDQQHYMNIHHRVALTQKDIWKDQTNLCTCGGQGHWSFDYDFEETGTQFKIALCECKEKKYAFHPPTRYAVLKTDTSEILITHLSNAKNDFDCHKKNICHDLAYFKGNCSTNDPYYLGETYEGQKLFWFKNDVLAGATVFSSDTKQDAPCCSNRTCVCMEDVRHILPYKLLVVCLTESKSKFFEKVKKSGLLYSAWSSQASLMAYVINVDKEKPFQNSTISCLGEIKSYKHLPDCSLLYVRSYQDESGNIKVACGDKQASFLDLFTVNFATLPTTLLHAMKTKIMPNKKSHDVHWRCV
jgi:hypothetical protein